MGRGPEGPGAPPPGAGERPRGVGEMEHTDRRIGVMGGTFDPIHYGHLVTAAAAVERFDLDLVVFVPAGQPPHKRPVEVSDSVHRYMMTVLATVANEQFAVSRIDVDRPGP